MALDGGGGGGGGLVGVSNSFTGAAQALEVMGDHAYGYSGVLDIGSPETDMLNFKTGNFYFVGVVQFNYVELAGETFRYRIYLNESIVQSFIDNGGSYAVPQPPANAIDIIIPPYTDVKTTASNIQDAALRLQVCSMVGRIYR